MDEKGSLSHTSQPVWRHKPPHTQPAQDLLATLGVDVVLGLSEDKAAKLLEENGPNRLKPPAKPSRLKIFMSQVTNAMTIVLLSAMAVSFGTMDWIAAGVIGALVFLNVSVGYSQEWKAAKTLAALESVGSPVATVIRHNPRSRKAEGNILTLPTEQVVVGDIVLVKIGDVVPADARILPNYISNLECDEALLTGESLPVGKVSDIVDDPTCPVGDRINMIYSGSQVTKGRARAVVTMTGMETELGKIADALERKEKSGATGFKRSREKVAVALGVAGTTPLQIRLNMLAYFLLGVAIVLAIIVVSSTGYSNIPESIATYAVAAAVSLLPASLVAVVNLTLAVACGDLASRNALVRRMDAVETLGGVTDICSDKTGTITVGRMVLRKAWVPSKASGEDSDRFDTGNGQLYIVESGRDPYYPRGIIRMVDSDIEQDKRMDYEHYEDDNDDGAEDVSGEDVVHIDRLDGAFRDLIQSAALNNMATLKSKEGKNWEGNGDPTEIALQVFAHKAGHGKPHLTRKRHRHYAPTTGTPLARVTTHISTHELQRAPTNQSEQVTPRVQIDGYYEMLVEHPFDSTIKRMSTAWKFIPEDPSADVSDYDILVYMKGAVERILDRCKYVGLGDNRVELGEASIRDIINKMDELASQGLRVLCLAGKYVPHFEAESLKSAKREVLESDCSFIGLVGIYDPPRPESRGAVMDSHRAGIVPRMLTGDHAATAASIARSVGILGNSYASSAVMTGQEFDALTEVEIDALPELPVVVARCAPETKVRMVEALHRRGRKTVMTGDGVNDSPALKRADVGVAMGLNGSDVAKGAADIVLADDNFSTIVRAIRKGRSVFQNLGKFLVYLLSGNVAEVVVLMIGLAFRRDGVAVYPISPVAALWINTIAAGPPALALGLEPTAKDAMDLSPDHFQAIFTPMWYLDTIGYGVFMGAQTLATFVIVQYGIADGTSDIETKCNDALVGLQPGCEIVFKARGTAFATLQMILMMHGLTCKNLTRSLFKMNLLENRLLLWSTGCLALSVFPIIYIPAINDRVFQVDGLTWHWALVFGQLVVYVVAVEMYKLIRRSFARNNARRVSDTEMHVAYTMEPIDDHTMV
ncbi:potassium/sodium eff [Hymenopellis radicata]|nr:potassium/sodium eff [Hymenopellis radicata]